MDTTEAATKNTSHEEQTLEARGPAGEQDVEARGPAGEQDVEVSEQNKNTENVLGTTTC